MAALQFRAVVRGGDDLLDHGITDMTIGTVGGQVQLFATSARFGGLAGYGLSDGAVAARAETATYGDGWTLAAAERLVWTGSGTGAELIAGRNGDHRLMIADPAADGGFAGPAARAVGGRLDGRIADGAIAGGDLFLAAIGGSLRRYDLAGGGITHMGALADPGGGDTAGLAALESLEAGGDSYLVGAFPATTGIVAWRVGAGDITVTGRLGTAENVGLMTPTDLAVAEVGGRDWVIAASAAGGNGALTVMELTATGELVPADHVLDTLPTRFGQVQSLVSVQHEGRAYLVARGGDLGLSLFTLLPGGRLLHLESVADATAMTLGGIEALAAAMVGDELQVFAASGTERGITQFALDLADQGVTRAGGSGGQSLSGTPGDDMLAGGAGADDLRGGAGADILFDGTGRDTLHGGAGADIFVLAEDGARDEIRTFDYREDRIDLSGLPFFYGTDGLDVADTWFGARIIRDGEETELHSVTGRLTRAQVVQAILDDGVHRTFGPPNLAETGGSGADRMIGSWGLDTLDGAGGDDMLDGQAGDDSLSGGDGADSLAGGTGWDRIAGGAGNDHASGGSGRDSLWGEAGDDRLEGGDDEDRISGGAGQDSLLGGAGADALLGNDGDDRLDGGAADDLLEGGTGADRLWGRDGNDRISAGGGHDTAWGAAGRDVIWADGGRNLFYGGAGRDTLTGGGGADRLRGDGGDDRLDGGDGDDDLAGGLGADSLLGGTGADTLRGEDGNDRLSGAGGNDRLDGGRGNDRLSGGSGRDLLRGDGGHDHLFGGAGGDTIEGGSGHDTLAGGGGWDLLRAGWGNDSVTGGTGRDRVELGKGNDRYASAGHDRDDDSIVAGDGDDWIRTARGDDRITGGSGSDDIRSGAGADVILGGSGRDRVDMGSGGDSYRDVRQSGRWGVDSVWGSAGADDIRTGGGNDYLNGGTGRDLLRGEWGNDRIEAGGGRDRVWGGTGRDRVDLGAGADTYTDAKQSGRRGVDSVWGSTGADDIRTGGGHDYLNGGTGNDRLNGQGDNDRLVGGAGRDKLIGGPGNDRLTGGGWADTFVFNRSSGNDRITDFNVWQDRLIFENTRARDMDIDVTRAGLKLAWNGETLLLEDLGGWAVKHLDMDFG